MIVTCPMCRCRYSVQPDAIGDGKFVRCAMCGSTWQQSPVDEAEEKKQRVLDLIKWTCFWFVVFISVFSLLFARDAVIKLWPASASFYNAVGLHASDNNKAFVVQQISNFFVCKKGKLYMGLRGEIVNISNDVHPLSGITISLKDDETDQKGAPYKRVWTHDLSCKKILPNQRIAFETEVQNVPYNNLVCDIELNVL